MLPFEVLIEKVKKKEPRYGNPYIEHLLGLEKGNLQFEIRRATQLSKEGKDSKLLEQLIKYCNYRDLDMATFFEEPLEEKVS